MSDIEIAVKASRLIESLLEQKLNATGKGLHSKLTSVENKLSSAMVSKIRYIASVRNNVVHEDGATIGDVKAFQKSVTQVEEYLNTTKFKTGASLPKLQGLGKKVVYLLVFLVALKIAAALIMRLN